MPRFTASLTPATTDRASIARARLQCALLRDRPSHDPRRDSSLSHAASPAPDLLDLLLSQGVSSGRRRP
jgi:hypothetical protein